MNIRPASESDIDILQDLIRESVQVLQAQQYNKEQREGALGTVFGVDSQLIRDGTYYVIEIDGRIAACGGWSFRSTLFGADAGKIEAEVALDPVTDAARIRAFFVSPDFVRQGLGTRILQECEARARAKGFHQFELVATLAGVPFYEKLGFVATRHYEVELINGAQLPLVHMVKW